MTDEIWKPIPGFPGYDASDCGSVRSYRARGGKGSGTAWHISESPQRILSYSTDSGGYKGVQVPSWDARLIDLAKAASSKDYCDEFKGMAAENGVEVTELSTHLQGQLVAVHQQVGQTGDFSFAKGLVKRWATRT